MSLRPPQGLGAGEAHGFGSSPIEVEIRVEQAAALGRAGNLVRSALDALRRSDAQPGSAACEVLVDTAAERVWGFLVQRELCGLRDERQVVADYAVPREVLSRAGAMKSKEQAG